MAKANITFRILNHLPSLRLRCIGRPAGEVAGFSTPQLVLRARSDLFAVAKFANGQHVDWMLVANRALVHVCPYLGCVVLVELPVPFLRRFGPGSGFCYFAPIICSSLPWTEKGPSRLTGRGKLSRATLEVRPFLLCIT
jgi:hypothetical protein